MRRISTRESARRLDFIGLGRDTVFINSYNNTPKHRTSAPPALTSARLLDQVRERLRYMHYSLQTEKSYVYWIKFFVRWHGRAGTMRHPRYMGQPEVESFLTMLANERHVSTSTHRQALSALLYLYKEVLGQDLPWLQQIGRPIPTRRIPSVLTREEVQAVMALVTGEAGLLIRLLYGTGMRRNEALSLRVKDIDFDRHAIIVREGKGSKDRVVMLPKSLAQPLREQLARSRVTLPRFNVHRMFVNVLMNGGMKWARYISHRRSATRAGFLVTCPGATRVSPATVQTNADRRDRD